MKDGLPIQATSYLPQSTLYTTEGFDKYTETVKDDRRAELVLNPRRFHANFPVKSFV